MSKNQAYEVILEDETAKKLGKLAEAQGIEDDLVFLEQMITVMVDEAYSQLPRQEYQH